MRISQICILTWYSDTIVLKRNDNGCSKKHSWILISSLMALVGLGKCDRLLLFWPLAFWPLYLQLPGRKRCCHPHQHPHVPVPKYLSFFLGRRPTRGSGSPRPLRLINRCGTFVRQCLSFLTQSFIFAIAILVSCTNTELKLWRSEPKTHPMMCQKVSFVIFKALKPCYT